ncbi:MAG: hypothetical protein II661_05410 [Bacteroidales bacterium]|nr:hypothetical protein [Bacteroidales bacterium]
MPYIFRRPFGALDMWLRLCAGVPLRSTPACIPSPLRGSGEHADYRIALDCRRNASKRHHLNNPTLSRRRSVGIRNAAYHLRLEETLQQEYLQGSVSPTRLYTR